MGAALLPSCWLKKPARWLVGAWGHRGGWWWPRLVSGLVACCCGLAGRRGAELYSCSRIHDDCTLVSSQVVVQRLLGKPFEVWHRFGLLSTLAWH